MPHSLASVHYFKYLSGCNAYGPANLTENPSIVIDPNNGHEILSWDNVVITWDTALCTVTGVGNEVYHSQSTNGGVNWAAPKLISATGEYPTVSVGPGPSYADNEINIDYGSNFTGSGGQLGLEFSRSTTDGASWSAPSQIVSGGINMVASPMGTGLNEIGLLFGGNAPTIATDNWTTSTHAGNIYAAWTDNMTGSNQGYTGIGISVSSNSGSTWSTPSYLEDASHASTYWDPSISVDSVGRVWVSFMAIYVNSGNVQEAAAVSVNGGTSWSAVFPVADTVTSAGTAAPSALPTLGPHFGLVGTTAGTYASWTDGRLSNDTSTYDTQVYFSQLFASSLATNAPEINATDLTYGQTTKVVAKSSAAGVVIWANGATHNVTVPFSTGYNATAIDGFTNFSGFATGTGVSISFSTSAQGQEFAFYKPVPAATISGTFMPEVAGAALTINGQAITLHPGVGEYTFLATFPGGVTYPYTAG
ncbi:MAG: glycoside hydrolase, partial [Thermoplasmata archaeon]|nr:glycoside hydrolase [Thermoplasmata archaeon]